MSIEVGSQQDSVEQLVDVIGALHTVYEDDAALRRTYDELCVETTPEDGTLSFEDRKAAAEMLRMDRERELRPRADYALQSVEGNASLVPVMGRAAKQYIEDLQQESPDGKVTTLQLATVHSIHASILQSIYGLNLTGRSAFMRSERELIEDMNQAVEAYQAGPKEDNRRLIVEPGRARRGENGGLWLNIIDPTVVRISNVRPGPGNVTHTSVVEAIEDDEIFRAMEELGIEFMGTNPGGDSVWPSFEYNDGGADASFKANPHPISVGKTQ